MTNKIKTVFIPIFLDLGVFLVMTKTRLFLWNALTVWTYIQEFQLSHEGVSKVSERAYEQSEQANWIFVERSASERVSGVSGASERT